MVPCRNENGNMLLHGWNSMPHCLLQHCGWQFKDQPNHGGKALRSPIQLERTIFWLTPELNNCTKLSISGDTNLAAYSNNVILDEAYWFPGQCFVGQIHTWSCWSFTFNCNRPNFPQDLCSSTVLVPLPSQRLIWAAPWNMEPHTDLFTTIKQENRWWAALHPKVCNSPFHLNHSKSLHGRNFPQKTI